MAAARPSIQVGKPPIAPGSRDDPARGRGLLLPHERDESSDSTPDQPQDPVIAQAHRDIERGLVDTDLRATPGLDAARRTRLLRESAAQSVHAARAGKRAKGKAAPPAPPTRSKRRKA